GGRPGGENDEEQDRPRPATTPAATSPFHALEHRKRHRASESTEAGGGSDPLREKHVLVAPLDLEAECAVERDRALVHRRGDAADEGASVCARHREEAVVQLAREPRAAAVGTNADEVDVRLVREALREEPVEEPH